MYDSGQIDFDGDQGSGFDMGGGMGGANMNDIFSMFMGGGMGGGMGGMGGMPGFFSSSRGGRGGRGGQTFEFRMG